MNTEELMSIYNKNLSSIIGIDSISRVANHYNNINKLSFTNRAMVFIQNKDVSDLRSEVSWANLGRVVKRDAIPISVFIPKIKTEYTDAETGKIIGIQELNYDEFNRAIKLGVIKSEKQIYGLDTSNLYDISDTNKRSENGYTYNRILELSALYKLLARFRICVDKNYFLDITDNAKCVQCGFLSMKLIELVEKLAHSLSKNLSERVGIKFKLNNEEIRLIEEYVRFSVLTYYRIETQFKLVDIKVESVQDVIDALDCVEFSLNSSVFIEQQGMDENSSIELIKAERLLSILESNYEYSSIRGD